VATIKFPTLVSVHIQRSSQKPPVTSGHVSLT